MLRMNARAFLELVRLYREIEKQVIQSPGVELKLHELRNKIDKEIKRVLEILKRRKDNGTTDNPGRDEKKD